MDDMQSDQNFMGDEHSLNGEKIYKTLVDIHALSYALFIRSHIFHNDIPEEDVMLQSIFLSTIDYSKKLYTDIDETIKTLSYIAPRSPIDILNHSMSMVRFSPTARFRDFCIFCSEIYNKLSEKISDLNNISLGNPLLVAVFTKHYPKITKSKHSLRTLSS